MDHPTNFLISFEITSEILKSINQKLNWQRNHRNAGYARIEGILWYNV